MNKTFENEAANKTLPDFSKVILALLGLLTLLTSAEALPFNYTAGDLCLGFRKNGVYRGNYEIVADLGPATNYIRLPAGATTNITQYVASQIDPDSYANLTNLSWSVTGETFDDTTFFPTYPGNTIWATVPRVNGVSAPAAARATSTTQQFPVTYIDSILSGAVQISSQIASNQDNTATCVQEPYSIANGYNYGSFMADPNNTSLGTLSGTGPLDVNGHHINLENTTVAPFSTPVQSDFYQLVPTGFTDPQSGTTSGAGYLVGYFQLNINGSMSFTRASTTPPPVAGFTGSPTSGFASLQVVFTDASTGTITTWLWNFGDGHSVTNTSNASVNHTYTSAGKYTVSLTVTGPGGPNTSTRSSYIVVAPTPSISTVTLASGNLVFSCTNGPAGVQYRILTSTNVALPLASWKPVVTNFFLSNGSFSSTNSTTNATAFFRLVSP